MISSRNCASRTERQVAYTTEILVSEHVAEYGVGPRKRVVYLTQGDLSRVRRSAMAQPRGITEALRTPDTTLIFVDARACARKSLADQIGLHGMPQHLPFFQLVARRSLNSPPARRPIRAASASRRHLQDIAHEPRR